MWFEKTRKENEFVSIMFVPQQNPQYDVVLMILLSPKTTTGDNLMCNEKKIQNFQKIKNISESLG